MVAATYGFVSAFGQNIALIPTLTTGMKWFPRNKVGTPLTIEGLHFWAIQNVKPPEALWTLWVLQGIAMGCVVGGFGGGALVFNFIQVETLYCLLFSQPCLLLFTPHCLLLFSDGHSKPWQREPRWVRPRRGVLYWCWSTQQVTLGALRVIFTTSDKNPPLMLHNICCQIWRCDVQGTKPAADPGWYLPWHGHAGLSTDHAGVLPGIWCLMTDTQYQIFYIWYWIPDNW